MVNDQLELHPNWAVIFAWLQITENMRPDLDESVKIRGFAGNLGTGLPVQG
jgi:hypothetical protein